jgi:hypothetical protein
MKFSPLPAALVLLLPSVALAQASKDAPFTNQDVVKLCKLDLGDEVVISKINQAKYVDFKLETDDLVKLKSQGVSKGVIAAMLKRATTVSSSSGAVVSPLVSGTAVSDEGVFFKSAGKEVRLQSTQGDLSRTWAYVTYLTFLDFPGLKADFRSSDRKPSLVIHSAKSPKGRIFLVKCESNKKSNNRSVKIGKASFGGGSQSWSSPDSDWTAEFDIKEGVGNFWEITPKKDLKPGEYGILFRGGFAGMLQMGQGELFDFGVD